LEKRDGIENERKEVAKEEVRKILENIGQKA
jgi:hypothetical protein